MNFNERYNRIKNLALRELATIEENMVSQINIREPLKFSLRKFLLAPAKRIRPLLAILYIKALGEELNQKQLEYLTVVEMVHNASLIHDDIIDESNIRRGKETINADFDNKLAVISGDYILALSMEKLSEVGNIELIKDFSQTIRQMCIGEINQNFDRFKICSIEDYIEKTKNKTAHLFEIALTGCVRLSTNQHDLQKISELGLNIGIAFQIRDDLINMTNSDTSKPSNNDFEDGIYTAPIILGNKSDNYASGIEKTKVLLNNYLQSAKQQVTSLPDNEYKKALEEFLELLNNV